MLLSEDKIDYPIHVNIRLTSDIYEDDEVIMIMNGFGHEVWYPPIETGTSFFASLATAQQPESPERLIYFDGTTLRTGEALNFARREVRCKIEIMSDCEEITSDECTLTIPPGDDGSLGARTFYQKWCGEFFLQWGLQHDHRYSLGEGQYMVEVDCVGVERETLLRYRLHVDRQIREFEALWRRDEEEEL